MVHKLFAASIKQHFGASETGGMCIVAGLDLLGVTTVEQGILLSMHTYAKI